MTRTDIQPVPCGGWGMSLPKPYYEHAGISIYHGDCRDILPLLPKVDLVLTDPPYGIALADNSAGGRHGRKRTASEYGILGDATQEVGEWVLVWARNHALPTVTFASPKKPWPGDWTSYLVWDKGPAVGGGGDVQRSWKQTWEMIQVARVGVLNGGRDEGILRYWVSPQLSGLHPAAKPVDLLKYLLVKTTTSSALVLDPFMGSGTTLVAAKNLGRKAIGCEIEERYCEIAAKRLAQEVMDFG